ncbi:MAG TPA: hypothetical protein VFO86_12760, partial [Terriglobia bacterium]|nr:hypothetical protein [Terriglobia bacterium]
SSCGLRLGEDSDAMPELWDCGGRQACFPRNIRIRVQIYDFQYEFEVYFVKCGIGFMVEV